jgi:hypothetical protein
MRDNKDMKKPEFLRTWTLKIILLVFGLNILAHFFFWYNSIWWFDMLMHFLGGLFLAVLALTLFWNIVHREKLWLQFLFVILFVLFVGLVWEVYEFGVQGFLQVTGIADIPDSISDLVFDVLGGVFGFLLLRQKVKNYVKS